MSSSSAGNNISAPSTMCHLNSRLRRLQQNYANYDKQYAWRHVFRRRPVTPWWHRECLLIFVLCVQWKVTCCIARSSCSVYKYDLWHGIGTLRNLCKRHTFFSANVVAWEVLLLITLVACCHMAFKVNHRMQTTELVSYNL